MPDQNFSSPSPGKRPDEFGDLHSLMDELETLSNDSSRQSLPVESSTQQVPPTPVWDETTLKTASAWRPLHLILFLLTCASTFFAGMGMAGDPSPEMKLDRDPNAPPVVRSESPQGLDWSAMIRSGFTYSLAVMSILFAHEMGHYLQARRYRVAASPPYFIPFPISPLGTMGAVIVQRSGWADRKKLFDIAISGPLAGLILAIPIAWIGISQAEIIRIPEGYQGASYGEPLLMQWMSDVIHGPRGPGEDLLLTPLLFAGWVGLFITGLNLIPIGQLDGGHILYSLIGNKAHLVAYAVIGLAIGFMIYSGNPSYSLMLVLIMLMGPRHPPTGNDYVPLGRMRIILGWLTLAFIIIGFTPVPIQIN